MYFLLFGLSSIVNLNVILTIIHDYFLLKSLNEGFLTPMSGHSQPHVTPDPGDPTLFWLLWAPVRTCAHLIHKVSYIHVVKKILNSKPIKYYYTPTTIHKSGFWNLNQW